MVILMSDTERIVENVNASMAMEGMTLTDSDKKRITDCLTGKKSYEDTMKELIELYSKAL